MTNIEQFNRFLDERMKLASSMQTMVAYTIVKSNFNQMFKPLITYELHFCEGSYMMAKVKGTEQGIIDNTLTEFIGEITCTQRECETTLILMQKAYELSKKFPIEEPIADKFPIVHCNHPSGKCQCSSFKDMHNCVYQC